MTAVCRTARGILRETAEITAADKLGELAEDIEENGFDHRYPITIAEVEGVWMLLDGRNRREAARMAGVVPPVVVTDIDPKLAVHRSNNQNRDATPGQKAMATAMSFPEAVKGGDRKSSCFKQLDFSGFDKSLLSRARYVLRNNPITEGQRYPQRCLAIMAGSLSLTEAYELTQADEKKRDEEEKIRKENAELLKYVRGSYPDLAALVDDERITLKDAIASAASREREAAEKKRREREEKEAQLAAEERAKAEAKRAKRAELVWQLTEKFTQEQAAKAMGWSREAVKNYKALNKIDADAWAVVGTGFQYVVPVDEDEGVPANGTGVPKSPFSENLLRNILDLSPDQQKRLCEMLAKGKDKKGHGFGHGNWLAMFHNKEVPFGISTADKLMKTATDERVSNSDHGPNLPPSWRTLYELAKLDDDT